jgi:adenosylhomocysteine nucleosidase
MHGVDLRFVEINSAIASGLDTMLDVEAGLRDVLVEAHQVRLARCLDRDLDLDAGLQAVLRTDGLDPGASTNPAPGLDRETPHAASDISDACGSVANPRYSMDTRSPLIDEAGPTFQREEMPVDQHVGTVVLTALEVEYSAVRELLTDLRTHMHPAGSIFETGAVCGTDTRVALALVGTGNHGTAVLVERAATLFQPGVMLFVGVAGALHSDIALGDVVVGTHVYGYHGGRHDESFRRPRAWQAPHGLEQHARHLARTSTWTGLLSRSAAAPQRVHFRPVVAGDIVLDSRQGSWTDQVRHHYNDAAAIEMEGASVVQVARLNQSVPLLTIRGISDRADGRKIDGDRDDALSLAASRAAAFALALALAVGMQAGRRLSQTNQIRCSASQTTVPVSSAKSTRSDSGDPPPTDG